VTIDPSRNVIVFLLARGEGEHAIADAPTRAEDAIQQAWQQVAREHRAQPAEVAALHSEWEAGAADLQFVRTHFPGAKVTYNFARPGPCGWEQAFEAARQVMAKAQEKHLADEAEARMQQVKTDGELLPVLWSGSAPNASAALSSMPHWPLVPGRLFVAFAMVAPTPRGTIGMSHMTHNVHQQAGSPGFDDLMGLASAALTQGLQIDGRRSEKGDLITIRREGSLAASALALSDFYQRLSGMLNDERLVVGLPCPDDLVVAGASSDWSEEITQMVLASPYPDTELVPSVLLVDATGMQLLAERG
jgi:hypothetical protein